MHEDYRIISMLYPILYHSEKQFSYLLVIRDIQFVKKAIIVVHVMRCKMKC